MGTDSPARTATDTRGTQGTTPGCSSLPTTWALNHLLCAEDAINLDVGACPRVFLGRKALQGPGRELEEGV